LVRRRALEDAGIEFIPAKNGKDVGVKVTSFLGDIKNAGRRAT
jgi:hypothetical protein